MVTTVENAEENGVGENIDAVEATGLDHSEITARAPYDRIVVTAGPEHVPGALLEQLARPGRLVIPVGPGSAQVLRVIDRAADGSCSERDVLDVRFVPMPEGLGRE